MELAKENGGDAPYVLPFLVESSEGHVPINTAMSSFVINSQSNLKDEAWQFIKQLHMDHTTIQSRIDIWSLPTNMVLFRDFLASRISAFEQFADYTPGELAGMSPEEAIKIIADAGVRGGEMAEQIAPRLFMMVNAMNNWDLSSHYIDAAARDDFDRLWQGLLTIEQLAGLLQDRFTLYLAE